VHKIYGHLLPDPQPAGYGEAPDVLFEDLLGSRGGTRPHTRARIAVHERVDRRVGQAEPDVQIPSGPQVLDRIGTELADLLLCQVCRESVPSDRVDQPALVPKSR
jgi:hypothetical protein